MPTFEFTSPDGKTYEIDGPPGSTKEQAFAVLQNHASAQPKESPSVIGDIIHAIPGGLAKGVSAVAGLPGDIDQLQNQAMHGIFNAIGAGGKANDEALNSANKLGLFPTSGDINETVSKPFGGFYEPQTTAGKYAETAASFAPALAGGEAGLGSKLVGRVLAPAAGSQLAGSAVSAEDHPIIRGAAEVGGALLGGGLASGARAIGGALLENPAPEQVANKYLANILKKQNINPATITQNAIPGRGQLGAEALGPNGVSMLATLGRRSGTTGEALGNALTTRAIQAPSRMMDDFTSAAGIDPRAAQGNFDNVLEAGKQRAAPFYEEAYKANPNIASPHLDRILDTPAGQKALSDARVKMQNDMSLMGGPDADLIAQAKEGGTAIPKNGVASGMKLRVYDYVKQSLDDQISSAYRVGNKNEGNIILDLKKSLVKALDNADITAQAGPNSLKPEGGMYAQARAAAGEYLGAQKAFEDGQAHILSPSVSADDVSKYVAKLSPTAQEAYKGGQANKILLQAQNGRLTPRLVGTPAVQQKLAASIGPGKAQEFIQNVQREADLARTGSRMMPGTGSITSDVLLNAGDQDSAAMLDAGMSGAKSLGHLLRGNPIESASHGISAFRKLSDLRKSGLMNSDVRNELGRVLMLPPEDLAAHLQALPISTNRGTSGLAALLMGKP